MKRYLVKSLVLYGLLLLMCPVRAAETLTIDPMHSYVMWYISHFDFSTQTGKWFVTGKIIFDKDKPQNSKVNVTIPVAEMVTGIPDLDKSLKGKLFFDAMQFPNATFVSDKIEITGKKRAKVMGMLTVHGVSKPITLNVKFNRSGINPVTNKMTAGFSGDTKLKRSDFGIKAFLPGVGDEVKLHIEVEAYKNDKKK